MLTKQKAKVFFELLEGEHGCNFYKDKKGEIKWSCRGNFDFARKLLRAMQVKNKDAEDFLSLCEDRGGYCDCEILFNAEDRILAELK